jgi:hypothetical protein
MASSKQAALRRPQVAALLSMSETEVRRLDGDRLHPRKAADGSYLYAPEEVVGLLRRLLRGAAETPESSTRDVLGAFMDSSVAYNDNLRVERR